MDRSSVARRIALGLLAAALLAPAGGCTAIDDYVDGTPFTPDQPEAVLTLVGAVNIEPAPFAPGTCARGTSVFWGSVQNTGDLDVDDVTVVIDAFGPAGEFLGSFTDKVYSGGVTESEGGGDSLAVTSLAVDQSGVFTVCSSLPHGRAARVEFRTEFVVIDTSGNP